MVYSDLLEKYTAANADLPKKRKSDHGIDSFFPKKPKTDKMANRVNHEQFDQLIALWSGLSLRPFSICEDALLQEAFTFATSVSGNLSLPSRNTNRNNILREASQMKKSIKHNIQLNCTYFSSTSDMWSSQTMKAFMALTIHFLTEEFMMRSYTLEAKPV